MNTPTQTTSSPDLTVVVVAPSGMATIERTLGCLGAQTAASRLEVLLVAPSAREIDREALGAGRFAALRTMEVGPITKRGDAAAAGVLAATAPVVALLEDHSYPEPTWAAALLTAHAEPWAGVGPVVENANPRTAMSRVTFWLTYAALSGPHDAGTRTVLPWHNTAYKRHLVAGYGDGLGALLQWEGNLQADLVARGHELYLEPAARTHHANVSSFTSALGLHFQRGRILAAQHAARETWPNWRRRLYAAAMPLFPLMQLRRIAPELRRLGFSTPRSAATSTPALASALMAMAAGEAVGYLTGAGDATDRLEDYELNRQSHLSRRELRAAATRTRITNTRGT